MNPLLIILLTPAIATVALFLIPGSNKAAIRGLCLFATLITLVTAVVAFANFDSAPVDKSLVEWNGENVAVGVANAGTETEHVYKWTSKTDWVDEIGLSFFVGVDGMGIAMVLLTAIIIFCGVIVSFTIQTRVKEYYVSLMALVTV